MERLRGGARGGRTRPRNTCGFCGATSILHALPFHSDSPSVQTSVRHRSSAHTARLSLTPERPCGYTRLSAPHALSLSRRHPCNTLITLLRRSQATHFQRRSSSTHHTLFSHIRRPIPRFRGGHGATRGGRYSQLPGRRPPGTHRRCAGGCPGAHLDVAYCAPAVGAA